MTRRQIARALLFLYLFSFLLIGFIFDFSFFVDSKTYLERIVEPPVISALVAIHPYGATALATLCVSAVFAVVVKSGANWFTIFLLTPYNLLLLTNLTREAVIFLGVWAYFLATKIIHGKKRHIIAPIGLLLLVVRPIYIVLFLFKLPSLVLLLGFALSMILYATGKIDFDLVNYFLEGRGDRAEVWHTGRDFFNYLCVPEKAFIEDFFVCASMVLLAFPWHGDTLSLRVITFGLFQLPFLYLLFKLMIIPSLQSKLLMAVALGLYYAIFYVSPTFGAFIRYAHPVLWICGFAVIYHFQYPPKPWVLRSRSRTPP